MYSDDEFSLVVFRLLRILFRLPVWISYLLCSLVTLINICSFLDTKPLDTISMRKKEKKNYWTKWKNSRHTFSGWLNLLFDFSCNRINVWFRLISMHVKIHLTLQRVAEEKRATKETTKYCDPFYCPIATHKYIFSYIRL